VARNGLWREKKNHRLSRLAKTRRIKQDFINAEQGEACEKPVGQGGFYTKTTSLRRSGHREKGNTDYNSSRGGGGKGTGNTQRRREPKEAVFVLLLQKGKKKLWGWETYDLTEKGVGKRGRGTGKLLRGREAKEKNAKNEGSTTHRPGVRKGGPKKSPSRWAEGSKKFVPPGSLWDYRCEEGGKRAKNRRARRDLR